MSTYETTTTTTSSSTTGIHPDVGYVKSIPGILKIVEFVLCIIVLICTSVVYWVPYGAGWIQFVAVAACVVVALLFIFHFLHIFEKLPGPWPLIEFVCYIVFTIFFLISAIVAAVRGGWHGSIAATAFFCFATTAVFGVDTFFQYRGWQTGASHTTSSSAATVETTTTTTSYETKTQY
ncbi:plasmolipin-like [Haliotis cracherodii]|uniref:plasmolipin-like n=1 Tax=Haliotis rufescens TaxID=6454 RepID=UPI00201F9C97|nr:plasmolipin-like [Haliotis rufescens]XP_046354554.2 plasmolipin-like [Haliotis rufescens]XP_048253466.1 plasmolipin-like [Haliotis rufescens]